jgi:hypothetical protein
MLRAFNSIPAIANLTPDSGHCPPSAGITAS